MPKVSRELDKAEKRRQERQILLQEQEAARLEEERIERERQEQESLRLAYELEKSRYTTRSLRVTRNASAHVPDVPKTAAEVCVSFLIASIFSGLILPCTFLIL